MTKKEYGGFASGLLGLTILLIVLTLFKIINTGQAIEIMILFALVLVTFIYAKRTSEIAKATRKQAEETRKQRYSESLPFLLPNIPPILSNEKLPIEAMKSGATVKVVWSNFGKGIAINARFSFWTIPTSAQRAKFFPPGESITLKVNQSKEIDCDKILNDAQTIEISKEYHPRLEAEYQDIHERKITTVQELRFDKENEIVSLGDLYFTINGRRLGQEVVNHD